MTLPRGPMGSGTQQQNTRTSLVVPDNSGSLVFPTAKEVENFHRNADTDKRPEAIHHSLGNSHNKAAFGDHTHDGSTSQPLFSGASATFNENLGTFQGHKDTIKQILTLLASIGAIDATTLSGQYPVIQTGATNITWTAAGAVSDSIAVAFATAFASSPRITATPATTNTNVFVPQLAGAITTTGFTLRLVAPVSIAAGTSIAVHWHAILMTNYT